MSAAMSNVTLLASVKWPDPLVPQDCDLRGLPCMLLDTLRLTRSGLTAHASSDEFRCAVLLWCESWTQLPGSSLPDDDDELAHLAHVSRTRWRKIRRGAMRGWIKCSDGRFYHPVVSEKAREAWVGRVKQRERAHRRWENAKNPPENSEQTGKNSEIFQENVIFTKPNVSDANDLADAVAIPENGKTKGKISEEDPPPPPAKRGRRKRVKLECPWFDMFFFDYPPDADGRPRGSPDKAEANWRRAVKEGADPERMYEAYVLDRDNLWPKSEAKWIPNPENWITKGRWKLLPEKQGDLLGGNG